MSNGDRCASMLVWRVVCCVAALMTGTAAVATQTELRRFSVFLDTLQVHSTDDWFGDDEPYLVAVSVSARLDGSDPKVRLERFGHGSIRGGTDWAGGGESYRFAESEPIQHWFDPHGPGSMFYLVVAIVEQDSLDNPDAAALRGAVEAAVAGAFRSAFEAAPRVAAIGEPQVADLLAGRLDTALAGLGVAGAIRAATAAAGDSLAGVFTVAAVSLPSGELLAGVAPGEAPALEPFVERRRDFAIAFPADRAAGFRGRYGLQGWLGLRAMAEAGAAAGAPSLIQSRFGIQGNFELVVPAPGGGLRHFWRNNDDATLQWGGPVSFGEKVGPVEAVSVIQSTFGSVGNLEAVAQSGDRLLFFWRPSDPGSDWRGPVMVASGIGGAPALIQSRFGARGSFEVVAPGADAGLRHYRRDNASSELAWSATTTFGEALGRVEAASLIQSNYGARGALEVVARAGDRLVHFRRGPKPDDAWEGPVEIAAGVAGNPALIQGRFGARGDFELVVPAAAGGLRHYWRDNDAATPAWLGPIVFGQELGRVDAVSLIQSNYGTPGNLELVARAGARLFYFWRGSDPGLAWAGPSVLATRP